MLSVNHSPHIRVFSKIETFLQAWVGVEKAQIMVVTRRRQGRPCDPISSSMYMMMMMMVLFHINLLYHGATDRPQVLVSSFMCKKLSKDRQFHSTYTTLHSGLYFVVCNESPQQGWLNPTALLFLSLKLSSDKIVPICGESRGDQHLPTYLPAPYLPTYLLTPAQFTIQDEWYMMDRKH